MASSLKASTLSPRERFQQSVQKLSSEDVHRHRRNRSIHLQYNPYELQHVSSLRVAPRRSPNKAESTSLRQVSEEPDFGSEERDIWSRKSPVDNKPSSSQTSEFAFYEDPSASPNPYESKPLLPLLKQPQIVVDTDHDGRPKTRHGQDGPSAFEGIYGTGHDEDAEERARLIRKAKFMEGTMTSRSNAVASSWEGSEYATSSSEAEETDSDLTPKLSRRRRSGSLDLRDFQPPTVTSSTIKRTLFGKRDTKKDKKTATSTKIKQEGGEEIEKPKRRLRKSMSKLQFLGEKMKLFGSSSQDLPEQAAQGPSQNELDHKAVLDERKRKAEAAYAEQFGHKKQRDNEGTANVTTSPGATKPVTLHGNQKYDSSTVRRRGGTHRSRKSTGSIIIESNPGESSQVSEHDFRKRPSRKELEKENQQLRALLRVSQAAREQEPGLGYSSETEPIPPVPPLKIRRSTGSSLDHTQFILETAADHEVSEPVPPLPPQHPDRRILGNVSNNRTRRSRRESFGVVAESDTASSTQQQLSDTKFDPSHPLVNAPKLAPTPIDSNRPLTPKRSTANLPRSVSVIAEEPEYEIDEKKKSLRSRTTALGKENSFSAQVGVAGKTEEWQWPDDCF